MLLNYHGREFVDHPELSRLQRLYVWIFGVPISGMRVRLRRILPKITGSPKKIIDLGCGKGVFTFELARRFPNARVVGVDIDSKQLEINRKIADKRKMTNIEFVDSDILDLDYKQEFDLALSVDNLEHIERDVDAIKKIRSYLKPNGKLVCHVPAFERIWIFRKIATNFDVEGHVRPGYKKEEIRSKLKSAGFKIESCQYTYGYLETVSNNISYLITGARQKNQLLYALAFPFLNLVAWMGRNQDPKNKGAGVLSVTVA